MNIEIPVVDENDKINKKEEIFSIPTKNKEEILINKKEEIFISSNNKNKNNKNTPLYFNIIAIFYIFAGILNLGTGNVIDFIIGLILSVLIIKRSKFIIPLLGIIILFYIISYIIYLDIFIIIGIITPLIFLISLYKDRNFLR